MKRLVLTIFGLMLSCSPSFAATLSFPLPQYEITLPDGFKMRTLFTCQVLSATNRDVSIGFSIRKGTPQDLQKGLIDLWNSTTETLFVQPIKEKTVNDIAGYIFTVQWVDKDKRALSGVVFLFKARSFPGMTYQLFITSKLDTVEQNKPLMEEILNSLRRKE